MRESSDQATDVRTGGRSLYSGDQTSRIIHELMRDFFVRSAVDPGDRGRKVIKAWHEAASEGR